MENAELVCLRLCLLLFLFLEHTLFEQHWVTRRATANVCMYVPMPTHCTITHFGFHARQVDGIECGLFLNHALLGQTALRVGLVTVKEVEVRVTVCVV